MLKTVCVLLWVPSLLSADMGQAAERPARRLGDILVINEDNSQAVKHTQSPIWIATPQAVTTSPAAAWLHRDMP